MVVVTVDVKVCKGKPEQALAAEVSLEGRHDSEL